jgi:hypothetical protein
VKRFVTVIAGALVLAGLAGGAAPPVISWQEAGSHVGEIVTVEGEVTAAHSTGDTCILEFAPGDPRALRAVLLLPVVSSLPPHPEAIYRGKRVRVSGRVGRFKGQPEMVLRSPDQIEVVDVGAPPAAAAVPPPAPAPPPSGAQPPAGVPSGAGIPPSASPEARAPAPSPTPAAEPPPPPPRGLIPDIQQRIGHVGGCERARARWRDAGATARDHATALSRCIDGSSYRCREESAALAPTLSELEWAEQQVEANCN